MAEKANKPKKQAAKPKKQAGKPKKGEQGVMASLPATRPERIGTRRGEAAPKTPPAGAGDAMPAAGDAGGEDESPAPSTPRPRVTAARRKAAAPRTFEPTQAAEAAAAGAEERIAGAPVPPASGTAPEPAAPRDATRNGARDARTSYPRPVSQGAPGVGTAGYRDRAPRPSRRPSGVRLVSGSVQAAGELARIGLTAGGRLLKGAARRLPRP